MAKLNQQPGFNPLNEQEQATATASGALIDSADLAYLNKNYNFPDHLSSRSQSQSTSLKTRVIQKLFLQVSKMFAPYLSAEKQFHASTVRCFNEISRSVDQVSCSIDDQYRATLIDLERRMYEQWQQERVALEKEIAGLKAAVADNSAQLVVLDSVAHGLERIVAQIAKKRDRGPANTVSGETASVETDLADVTYLLLENRYRGSEEEISRRLANYVDVFSSPDGSASDQQNAGMVCEIGAGRGELQRLLSDAGIASYGLEQDVAMVERCAELGLDVRLEDGVAHLANISGGSLAGVVAIQVVEHMPIATLREFLSLCRRAVRPGGRILLETINTSSFVALAQNFFRDPTHQHPLHPETMKLLVEQAGLKVQRLEMRSPYPAAVELQKVPVAEYLTPRWQATVELLNHNFSQLNSLLFGHQDYCLVAEVPTEE